MQIFRVSKREAFFGGMVKRVPRSGVYDADPVVRLAFTYLGQVMARRRLFVYTKLDASHLETRRWILRRLQQAPLVGLGVCLAAHKRRGQPVGGGVQPIVCRL